MRPEQSRQLIERTRVAARAQIQREGRLAADGAPLRVGDVVVTREAADVQWSVVEDDAARGLRLVPTDTMTLAAGRDLVVRERDGGAPLVLRCAHAVWVDHDRLATAERTGALPQDAASTARARADGDSPHDPSSEEIEADPEYQDWIEEVVLPSVARWSAGRRTALVEPLAPAQPAASDRFDRAAPAAPRSSSALRLYRLAAGLLLVTSLALGGYVQQLRSRDTVDYAAVQGHLPTAHLYDLAAFRSEAPGPGAVVALGADDPNFVLHVTLPDDVTGERVRLDITTEPGGDVVWSVVDLRAQPLGTVRVVVTGVPVERVGAGSYSLALYAGDGTAAPIVVGYPLAVVVAP